MARVLITDKISPEAVSRLSKEHEVTEFFEWEPEDLKGEIKGFDALVVRSRTKVTKGLIDSADRLKVIARAGAGLDNVDKEHAESKGIKVLNTPTANSLSVAELTLGLALALLRNVPKADRTTREGHWEKKTLKGMEVSGKRWGIVGFGHIGRLVAGLLSGFKCEILTYDPYVTEKEAVANGAKLVSLKELLRDSDIVSVHVPLLDSTKGLIGGEELSLMKETAIIINISRGGIIDEKALHDVLSKKKILGAALDVYEKEPPEGSPLLELENTVFTCHLGAQTIDAQKRVGEQTVDLLLDALG